jgi:hypothetical protein
VTIDLANAPAFATDPAFTTRYAPLSMGQVGSALATVAQGPIGNTDTAITNLTITFTAVAGRRYRLSWMVAIAQAGFTGTYDLVWRLGGVNQSVIARESLDNGYVHTSSGVQDLGVLGAGSKTVALSIKTAGGTLTVDNASCNSRMYIDDAGT